VLFIDALQRMVRIAQEGMPCRLGASTRSADCRRRFKGQAGDGRRPHRDQLVRPLGPDQTPQSALLTAAPRADSTPSGTVCLSLGRITMRHALTSVYLTGATLFLSLILSRVFYIILDFIHVQENYTTLQAKVAKQSGNAGEAEELRKRIRELEAEGRDFGASRWNARRRTGPHGLTPRQPQEAGVAAERRVQPTRRRAQQGCQLSADQGRDGRC